MIRFRVYGSPAWAERFWSKVNKAHPSGCWIWIAARDADGYGSFWLEGKQVRAHRVAYALLHPGEEIPVGLVVRHTCDNPPCVRHLVLGTPRENDQDRVLRNRSAQGDQNGSRLYPDRLSRGSKNHMYRPAECRNGHPLSGRYTGANGERRCTECQRQRIARWRAKKRRQEVRA